MHNISLLFQECKGMKKTTNEKNNFLKIRIHFYRFLFTFADY